MSRHVRTAILIKELRLERARTKLALDEAFEATQRRLSGASAAGLLNNSLAQVDAACEALRASRRATMN